MTHENVRNATIKAVTMAKKNGALISVDPNLRLPLWDSPENAREQMLKAISYCDILKISDNEINFITELDDYDEGIAQIQKMYGVPLIFLTMGKDGSRAYYKTLRVEAKGIEVSDVVDTTGAGDTFCGAILGRICDLGINNLTEEQLLEMITYANAVASLVTQKKGAIKSMPNIGEIDERLKKNII